MTKGYDELYIKDVASEPVTGFTNRLLAEVSFRRAEVERLQAQVESSVEQIITMATERDEARAEAEKAKERTLWAMTRLSDVDAKLARLETAHAKLREERDALKEGILAFGRVATIEHDSLAGYAWEKLVALWRREEKGGE